ncbi:hypothetical protein QFZ27_000274 [Inquilinus ginsengisoli]|uniref:hypothetical protein n=1 Tax=Inquilinus ginsengisoli TaxID=363840 RepID=UPI003D22B95B
MDVSCVKEGLLIAAAEVRASQSQPEPGEILFRWQKESIELNPIHLGDGSADCRNQPIEIIPITQITQVYLLCYAD